MNKETLERALEIQKQIAHCEYNLELAKRMDAMGAVESGLRESYLSFHGLKDEHNRNITIEIPPSLFRELSKRIIEQYEPRIEMLNAQFDSL